jgi:HPt (histidine-containing phosphotransfer) domain-containing protein
VWDKFKNNRPSSGAAAAPALKAPALSPGAEASVRQLIANGKHKVAVETAKEIHKALATAASEALLVDAYAARIQSLVDQNLTTEAKALLELVRERYPSARERLNGRNAPAATNISRIEELVRPLNDPELSPERRAAIEAAIAREVGGLAALAECAVLPPEHPLRQAASELQRAFCAVTAGPVDEQAVELPEVSHRSPLASWKRLVRAIACFYRGEDDACRRYLEAIQLESAPASLVPAMHAMLGEKPAGLTGAAAALVSSTTSDSGSLRTALESLEAAFNTHKDGAIFKAVREAVQACRATAPGQIERLKQHISVRSAMGDVQQKKVEAAMGGAARQDAYYARLFARCMEEIGDTESIGLACFTWNEFRQQAVREGWFTANGPEAATLYLHMAGVLRRLSRELLLGLQKTAHRQNRKTVEEIYFLYPEKLYERACALDPHFESFSQWMDWARRDRPGHAEKVAEAWHKVLPLDIEPILLLMEEKEKRNAFHTSLQYLAKAERIDSVHPAVRRARLRLLAGSVLRHIQQKKPALAEEKLAEMETLPQSQQGDRPALLAALRYMVCAVRGAAGEALAQRAEVERVLGGKAAAALLIFGVAQASKQGAIEKLPPIGTLDKAQRAALPEAVVRVVELARDMQMTQPIPPEWLEETAKQFPGSSQSLSAAQLQTLAEAASLHAQQFKLTYAVCAAGLERGGPTVANFLLLRAQTLPPYPEERRAVCAAAAAQLARQQRQMDVVDKAVELIADSPFEDLRFSTEQASTVVRKEKAERTFPTANARGPGYRDLLSAVLCDCPKCRRARGEPVSPVEDFDFDFDADPNDDDGELDFDAIIDQTEIPPDMPPEIAKLLFDETRRAVERGESLDSLLNRVFGPEMGFRPKRRKGRRR